MIFDLDGTLVDTVQTRISAWLEVFAELGIPAAPEVVAPLIGSDGRWLARRVAGLASVPMDDARSEEVDRRAGEVYGRLNREPRPLSGARSVLETLHARGDRWAIATSSRREQVAASVAALRLSTPPLVVDGTHVAHAKPAPDLLLLAARELGVAPERAWYVGDSTWDMEAAVAAGMRPVGVTTGSVPAAALRASGASEVLGSLDQLLELLEAP